MNLTPTPSAGYLIPWGLVLGLLILKSWVLALALAGLSLVCALAARPVFDIWLAMIVSLFFLSNYMGMPVNTVCFWGLCVLFMASVLWRSLRRRGYPIVSGGPFWAALILWYGWAVLAALMSPDRAASIKEVVRYVLLAGTLFAYLQWFSDASAVPRVLRVLHACLVLYAVLFLSKIAFAGSGIASFWGSYWHSDAESASFFAAFLPFFMSLFPHMRGLRWQRYLGAVIILAALVAANSGSALLSAGAGVLALAALRHRRAALHVLLLSAALVLGSAVLLTLFAPGLGEHILYQLSGRERIWGAALRAALSNPVFGIGPGRWSAWFGANYNASDFIFDDLKGNIFFLNPSVLGGQAHNLFLTKSAEMGFPSLLLLCCVFWFWFRKAISVYRSLAAVWQRDLVRGCLASCLGLTLFCLFENGPIIGVAREGEIVLMTILLSLPLAAGCWQAPQEDGST